MRLASLFEWVYRLSVTARPLTSIGDVNAGCAPVQFKRREQHMYPDRPHDSVEKTFVTVGVIAAAVFVLAVAYSFIWL